MKLTKNLVINALWASFPLSAFLVTLTGQIAAGTYTLFLVSNLFYIFTLSAKDSEKKADKSIRTKKNKSRSLK